MLNDCKAGLHGGGIASAAMSETGPLEEISTLKGASTRARSKRDAIYKYAGVYASGLSILAWVARSALDASKA